MLGNLVVAFALAGPSALLAPTQAAPTNVTVAWASAAHDAVVVTWDETGDVRNRVELVNPDGSPSGVAALTVEAGQPNRSALPGFGAIYNFDLQVAVSVVDEDDQVISAQGLSPVFDTNAPPQPVIETVVPREDGTVAFSWRPGAEADTTPGDPLDVPAETPVRFTPFVSYSSLNDFEALTPAPVAVTSFVVPDREKPIRVGVRTTPNEWSFNGESAPVDGTRVTATIPKKVTIGAKLTVTGKAVHLTRACDPGVCWAEEHDDAGRLLRLQARANAKSAWQTVATTRARADGTFTVSVKSPGTRDYRVVAPPVARTADQEAKAYFATPATTTKAKPPATGGGGYNEPEPEPGTAGGTGGTGGGDGGGLPITGAPAAAIALTGGLLIAFGAVFLRLGRRRTSVTG
ncbi:hypothetical protein [Paractinoplanes atraurantiacus]|uniref:LPXTG-motif cell wall anchor domain-containing protein n=1 Tax=Paractinoplanes atraurantiacus TaxID=1036182 RepID=A0A285FUL1_9ACTN|nr:hypothetical protein [Actinoplanes atraurantiacus]SNY14945.1 hypothetical protein SAMN05421748_1011248 [Actinoplanes atraurantiacus]